MCEGLRMADDRVSRGKCAVDSARELLAEQHYREGVAAFRRGDNNQCRQLSQLALDEAIAAGSDRVMALAHVGLSRAAFREGAYVDALDHAQKAAECALSGNAEHERMMALHMRAEVARAQRKYKAAVPLYRELLAWDEASGDTASLAMEHYNLGSVLVQTGALDEASEHLERAVSMCSQEDDLLPYTLLGLGGVLARRGDVRRAGQLIRAVTDHLAAVGEVLDPAESLELESHLCAARDRDASAFEAGYADSLSVKQAVALISGEHDG